MRRLKSLYSSLDDLHLFDDQAGHPCVTISGKAFSYFERTCMK